MSFQALREFAESKRKRREESGCAMVDELEWVPDNLTVKSDARTRHGNTDKAGWCEYNRNYDELDMSMRILVSGAEMVEPLPPFS
jgi:hypothetical protein